MKKAYELTTLTGTQALLLIASETGHVYTFATSKLQPFVTHHEGKALIQRCLNSSEANLPDNGSGGYSQSGPDISQLVDTISIFTYLQVNEDSQTSAPQEPVESNLILLVGKKIPCASFTAANMADLRATVANFSQDGVPITALAGGVPNAFFDHADQSNNHMLINADVVAGMKLDWTGPYCLGIKVAEVDYTSERQPAFSVEDLRHYLQDASSHIPNELWSQIAVKPYINFPPESLVNEGYLLYVVSTYRNAFVNVVFGVRKIGDKGHQVVGISCMPPDNHICCLDVDEASHQARMDMTTEVEGQPLYHLLPELKGV